MHRFVRPLLAFALVVGLVACGGGDGGGGGDAADADVTVTAVSGFEFEPAQVTAEAGELTLALVNENGQRHTLVLDDPQFKIDAQGGDTATGTVELEPGTYTFYCDVPGHRPAGMEGTLEVQ